MDYLYCLKLKPENRWYVGITPEWRWEARHEEHASGNGAQWVRRHGYEKVVWKKLVPSNEARKLEDIEVCNILRKHGLNAARGGLFNLRNDCTEMPSWIVRPYFEHASEIMDATAVSSQ